MMRADAACALGVDAGSTATRWALADAQGVLRAEGEAPPVSGLQLAAGEAGVAAVDAVFAGIAAALPRADRVSAVWAGLTGFDAAAGERLAALLARHFGIERRALRAMNDIELLCRSHFGNGPGGGGIVVYAGTGSIAARLEPDGTLARAGGRGPLIDDAGGGHWIAAQALRQLWRDEDARPGGSLRTPLARHVYARIGGTDWAACRAFVYGASRGELGTLALAVAEAARDGDTFAEALLRLAGAELARLANVLIARTGPQPVGLAGRVFELHPVIEEALREALRSLTVEVRRLDEAPHRAAAKAAAREAATALKPAEHGA